MNSVEILDHGTRVHTAQGAGFGTDALLLARFATPKLRERALDLCSGCGIVALIWHDAGHRGPCTALELDPDASALCAQSVQENDAGHITPLCADLRDFCRAGPEQGAYDFAACNPPYFAAGPRSPDPVRAAARHTDTCTLADAVGAAARALREGGRFVLGSAPTSWWRYFVLCGPPGWNPNVSLSPGSAPAARRGFSWWKRRKAVAPACAWNPIW